MASNRYISESIAKITDTSGTTHEITSGASQVLFSHDDRAKYPGSIFSATQDGVAFMQNSTLSVSTGTYSDVFVLRGYTDSSGGRENALIFSKDTDMSVYHTQFDFGSTTSWGTPITFLDSSNYTTYAAKASHTHSKSDITDFPTIPTVNNGTLTIQGNGSTIATFTANQSGNTTANITYSNVGAAASGHTHTCSIASTTNTNNITLSHGSKYLLTAGGSSYVFTMPSAPTSVNYASYSNYSSYLKVSTYSSGNAYLVGSSSSSANTTSTAYVTSSVYFNGGTLNATTFNATSDARLKENLELYECEASVLDLPVYRYDFKDCSLKNQIGCLAQDLQKICPEIVSEGEGGYLSIQESKIVFLLLQELKRQSARIDELEKKIGEIE